MSETWMSLSIGRVIHTRNRSAEGEDKPISQNPAPLGAELVRVPSAPPRPSDDRSYFQRVPSAGSVSTGFKGIVIAT